MSYEGYTQYLCPLGHYWTEDAMAGYYCEYSNGTSDSPSCPHCKASPVWENMVDTTNGSSENIADPLGVEEDKEVRIDGYIELVLIAPPVFNTCPTCNHSTEVSPAQYEIPKEGGHRLVDGKRID